MTKVQRAGDSCRNENFTNYRVALIIFYRCIALYKYEPGANQSEQGTWGYLGKYRAHTKPITGLVFGTSGDTLPRLLSIAEDRTMVEFDVQLSSIAAGLVLKSITKIEQVAVPTSIVWHPRLGKEDFIVVASDQVCSSCIVCVGFMRLRVSASSFLFFLYSTSLNSTIPTPRPAEKQSWARHTAARSTAW